MGRSGQERIAAATVVVIGCGGLGSAVVEMLARGGVGRIRIVDRDLVELSNLQRQHLFDEHDVATCTPKAIAAARAVAEINASVQVDPHVVDVTPANIEGLIEGATVVVDGTDNIETRYLLNDACVKHRIPWVYGAAIGSTGMSLTVVPGETACFRCLFPTTAAAGAPETCETAGILGSVVATVAAHQWTEVVKLLIGARDRLSPGLLAFDVWTNDRELVEGIERRADCPCCALGRYEFLEADAVSRGSSLCGRNLFQVTPGRGARLDLPELARRLSTVGRPIVNEFLVRFAVGGYEITVFADGRAFIRGASSEGEARSVYARWIGA